MVKHTDNIKIHLIPKLNNDRIKLSLFYLDALKTIRTLNLMRFQIFIWNNYLSYSFLDLEEIVSDHETRLTAAEENIQGALVCV